MPVAKKEKVTAAKTVKIPEAGAKKPFARVEVSAAQERKILALLKGGKSRREVSEAVGLSQMQIDRIRKAHGLHKPRVKRADAAKKPAVAKAKSVAPKLAYASRRRITAPVRPAPVVSRSEVIALG